MKQTNGVELSTTTGSFEGEESLIEQLEGYYRKREAILSLVMSGDLSDTADALYLEELDQTIFMLEYRISKEKRKRERKAWLNKAASFLMRSKA